jgi:hypothetical protein
MSTDENYTPESFINFALDALGIKAFDLDPCSSLEANQIVRANAFYTINHDGLERLWMARSIWMNPPFSNPAPWVNRLARVRGAQWACLTSNDTSVPWARVLFQHATDAIFLAGRHQFWGPEQRRRRDEGKKVSNSRGSVIWLHTQRPVDVIANAMSKHRIEGDAVWLGKSKHVLGDEVF